MHKISTRKSKDLDNKVKKAAKTLAFLYQDEIEFKSKVVTEFGTMIPDGGGWFRDGKLIAVFEAKHQENQGNAIERWYKNQYLSRQIINPDVTYVTIASGLGSVVGGKVEKILSMAHPEGKLNGYNKIYPRKNCYFYKARGWTYEEVESVIFNTLETLLDG
jgi:hypothetical protein